MNCVRDTSLDLTAEELVVLSELTGAGTPAGFDEVLLAEMPEAVRAYRLETAERTLRDRRIIVDGAGGGAEVDDAVATVLRGAASPGLLVVAMVEADGIVETRFYTVDPDLGIEQQPIAPGLYRFIPFPAEEVLRRALRFADLRPHEQPTVAAFKVAASTLEAAGELIANGEDEAAAELLAAAGADSDAAAAFVAAVGASPRTVSVTVFYRPEADKVAGGSLTWIDAGLDGLWCTEPVDDDASVEDTTVELRPDTGTAVARELLSYLPPAFSEPPAPLS
jgi:hypothetical protein